jgi:hypothetical protein
VVRSGLTLLLDWTGPSPTPDRDRLDWWNHWYGLREWRVRSRKVGLRKLTRYSAEEPPEWTRTVAIGILFLRHLSLVHLSQCSRNPISGEVIMISAPPTLLQLVKNWGILRPRFYAAHLNQNYTPVLPKVDKSRSESPARCPHKTLEKAWKFLIRPYIDAADISSQCCLALQMITKYRTPMFRLTIIIGYLL